MSAQLSRKDLEAIFPEVAEREFPTEGKPDEVRAMNAEAERLNAETRLIKARRARKQAEQATNTESPAPPPKPKAPTVPPSFWVALAIALAQFAAFLVLLIKY